MTDVPGQYTFIKRKHQNRKCFKMQSREQDVQSNIHQRFTVVPLLQFVYKCFLVRVKGFSGNSKKVTECHLYKGRKFIQTVCPSRDIFYR